MAGSLNQAGQRKALAAALAATAVFFVLFPAFRIVPLPARGDKAGVAPATGTFDPVAAAAHLWQTELPAAAARATELTALAGPLRADPVAARRQFAKASGLGTAYYFVRGRGRVVARERNTVILALDGADGVLVALRTGPVFGNTVRDGCGLVEVNAYPGLQEFNALAAELNALVEKNLLPVLRDQAVPGAILAFAGCAEAPDSVGPAGEPILTLIPVPAGLH